jgi:hypothetical protein
VLLLKHTAAQAYCCSSILLVGATLHGGCTACMRQVSHALVSHVLVSHALVSHALVPHALVACGSNSSSLQPNLSPGRSHLPPN